MAASPEYENWWPSYADLPMEIILHIFRYLEHADLQAAGAACIRWRDALLEPEFNEKTLVYISKVCLSDRLSPARHFLGCERPFRYVCLEEVTFGYVHDFMERIGKFIVELTLDNVDIGDKQFYAIMRQLPRLQRLTVTRCSPLFMSGSFLENNEDRLIVDSTFANLKHLSLSDNQYLSDAILMRLTALIEAIETLDMSNCHIAYHNAIHRRFYPNDTMNTTGPSESILTFRYIARILSQHTSSLRELNLSQTLLSGPALMSLCELEFGPLQLLRLRLAGCRQLTFMGMKTFLHTQPQLLVLDLSDTLCVNYESMEVIVTATPLLEDLNIAGCTLVSNEGAALLGTLKHLRRLNISRCDGISTNGIVQGIARSHNTTLRELNMSHLKVCDECIKCIASNLPELRKLNVSHCVNGITDDAVQSLIQHLRWLRELSLEDCCRITDTAITGINVSSFDTQENMAFDSFNPTPTSSIAEREFLNNSVQSMKISLRSKAEEEIVNDANRKKAMLAAYELNLVDENNIEGYNIQQLRGLKSLNLKGCNKITDVSLKYGLKFSELRQLSISNCQQISVVGMEKLVLNCPSIEELDLSDCYNINDKTIQIVTTKLNRLRALHISGCTQLTDHSVDAILVNCKNLKTLSVYRCRRMYTDIEDRLAELTTLRNLNMDNATTIDNAEIFRLKKRLDY